MEFSKKNSFAIRHIDIMINGINKHALDFRQYYSKN